MPPCVVTLRDLQELVVRYIHRVDKRLRIDTVKHYMQYLVFVKSLIVSQRADRHCRILAHLGRIYLRLHEAVRHTPCRFAAVDSVRPQCRHYDRFALNKQLGYQFVPEHSGVLVYIRLDIPQYIFAPVRFLTVCKGTYRTPRYRVGDQVDAGRKRRVCRRAFSRRGSKLRYRSVEIYCFSLSRDKPFPESQ